MCIYIYMSISIYIYIYREISRYSPDIFHLLITHDISSVDPLTKTAASVCRAASSGTVVRPAVFQAALWGHIHQASLSEQRRNAKQIQAGARAPFEKGRPWHRSKKGVQKFMMITNRKSQWQHSSTFIYSMMMIIIFLKILNIFHIWSYISYSYIQWWWSLIYHSHISQNHRQTQRVRLKNCCWNPGGPPHGGWSAMDQKWSQAMSYWATHILGDKSW